mmetsp:Transcript_29359/g.68082  ORF Transcript_29359/g.68082 Transcript_29359/m.68082 type:complete len:265 (-) Transcript_29359:41-835(-)
MSVIIDAEDIPASSRTLGSIVLNLSDRSVVQPDLAGHQGVELHYSSQEELACESVAKDCNRLRGVINASPCQDVLLHKPVHPGFHLLWRFGFQPIGIEALGLVPPDVPRLSSGDLRGGDLLADPTFPTTVTLLKELITGDNVGCLSHFIQHNICCLDGPLGGATVDLVEGGAAKLEMLTEFDCLILPLCREYGCGSSPSNQVTAFVGRALGVPKQIDLHLSSIRSLFDFPLGFSCIIFNYSELFCCFALGHVQGVFLVLAIMGQ